MPSGEHRLWTGSTDRRGLGQLRVDGRLTTARRAAWVAAFGEPGDGAKVVVACGAASCIRPEHLRLDGEPIAPPPVRRRGAGGGTLRERSARSWELAVSRGVDGRGQPQRVTRTFHGSRPEAERALALLVAEVEAEGMPEPSGRRGGPTIDDLVAAYWTYAAEQGRAHSTLVNYRVVYDKWLQPDLGSVRASDLDERRLDSVFGAMRTAGRSHTTMNTAKVVLSNAFKLGRRYRLITRPNPMKGYELPKSMQAPRETVAPELEELVAMLDAAERLSPELAPILKVGAVTGCRRGELAGLRRSRVDLDNGQITIDHVVSDAGGKVVVADLPKTSKARTLAIDAGTVTMLRELLEAQDAAAAAFGLTVPRDAYLFGPPPDHSRPMRPDRMTHLMFEFRREHYGAGGASFDATILALRKFTTTELLDAGFNPSMISSRQGHTTQTMLAHYGKRRRSADRSAAAHLGAGVHGTPQPASGAAGVPS